MTSGARDVVVIGGGIVGCQTAYLLAKAGATVTILEADSVASHASGFAFGEMGALEGAGIPDPLLDFTLWSHQRHITLAVELQEISGVDPQFRLGGRIKLALSEDDATAFQEAIKWQKDIKELRPRWLDATELVKAEPQINPASVGGVYVENSGSVEPYRYTLAAAQSAEKLGADMVLRRARGLIGDQWPVPWGVDRRRTNICRGGGVGHGSLDRPGVRVVRCGPPGLTAKRPDTQAETREPSGQVIHLLQR